MARRPRAALCGAGPIAGVHAAAAAVSGVEVTAVASRTATRAAAVARRVGARPTTFADLPAGADLVVVCTPPSQHLADTRRALAAGVPVILERPLCPTLAEADELVTLAAAHGERVLYAENLAHAPVVQEFVRRARALTGVDHLHVRAETAPVPERDGILLELGPSALAVLVLAAAPAQPRHVAATVDPAGDHAVVTIMFDTGLEASVTLSRRGGPVPVWDAQASCPTGVVRAEIHPSPALEANGDGLALPSPTGKLPEIEHYGYRGEWATFLEDLQRRRPPVIDVAFGRLMLDLVCAAAVAARRGALEPIPYSGRRDRSPAQLLSGD